MGKALYRKYRSRSLDEIVGQDHVTELLANAIKQDKVAHAYLFTGPRGVGKTSIARIIAHAINDLPYKEDETHLDIIEIDAASNNGVEDIRDLRDRVQIAPVSAKKKVYIIDEVHMLSKPAFNALLKTLEEPPEHIVFILATTDVDKVPQTILSRTQRHTFRKANEADIVSNLKRIAKAEDIKVTDEAYSLIAKHADGSFRDSVSLFDQLRNSGDTLDVKAVIRSLGLASSEQITGLLEAVDRSDIPAINDRLNALESAGVPARTTALQLIHHLRSTLGSTPSYVALMNALLDVTKSHNPEIKLLTTLGLSIPQQVAQPTAAKAALKQVAPVPPSRVEKVGSDTAKSTDATSNEAKAKKSTAKSATANSAEPSSTRSTERPFDWDGFLAHIKTDHVALHSVLNRCQAALEGDTLKVYTGSTFFKNKLDTAKYKQLLNESLNELGYAYEFEMLSSRKPMDDSQAERIAAMMGGGEEVPYE